MKKLKSIQSYDLPNLKDIEEFENLHKMKIPYRYKLFLISQNVYLAEENNFVCNNGQFEIHHFYPFSDSAELSLKMIYNSLKGFFKNSYLSFADDSGGWQYVISLKEEDYGKVYFCRMDEALEDALTLLADSFEEFINKLEISPDESV